MMIELSDALVARPSILRRSARWVWTAAFVLSCGFAGAVLGDRKPGLLGTLAILLVPMLLLFLMIREVKGRATAQGCLTAAGRRYSRRMMLWGPGYVVALFGALWTFRHMQLSPAVVWPLALLPAVPILLMIWSVGRYMVEETDEYQRMKVVHACVIATGVLLAVATVWGFLELFALVPHVEPWVAMPIWSLGLGLGQCIQRLREA